MVTPVEENRARHEAEPVVYVVSAREEKSSSLAWHRLKEAPQDGARAPFEISKTIDLGKCIGKMCREHTMQSFSSPNDPYLITAAAVICCATAIASAIAAASADVQ